MGLAPGDAGARRAGLERRERHSRPRSKPSRGSVQRRAAEMRTSNDQVQLRRRIVVPFARTLPPLSRQKVRRPRCENGDLHRLSGSSISAVEFAEDGYRSRSTKLIVSRTSPLSLRRPSSKRTCGYDRVGPNPDTPIVGGSFRVPKPVCCGEFAVRREDRHPDRLSHDQEYCRLARSNGNGWAPPILESRSGRRGSGCGDRP